jgi:hypothetical protein
MYFVFSVFTFFFLYLYILPCLMARLGRINLWQKGKGFQRVDNSKKWKYAEIKEKKKIFSRTSKPNSIKLGTNYSCVKGNQVFSSIKDQKPLRSILWSKRCKFSIHTQPRRVILSKLRPWSVRKEGQPNQTMNWLTAVDVMMSADCT